MQLNPSRYTCVIKAAINTLCTRVLLHHLDGWEQTLKKNFKRRYISTHIFFSDYIVLFFDSLTEIFMLFRRMKLFGNIF
jgi:hypothetical protein